jgi:hypothetical protein
VFYKEFQIRISFTWKVGPVRVARMAGATPTVPRDGYLLLQEVIQHLSREREVKDGRSHAHCPQG